MKQKTAFKEKSAWYTALVILYLLFCVGLSLAYRDTGAVLSGWQLGILEPDGTYAATTWTLVDLGWTLVLCALFPGALLACWNGKLLPDGPRKLRQLTGVGYAVCGAVYLADMVISIAVPAPHAIWLYLAYRAPLACLYLYLRVLHKKFSDI